jgi:AraC-like DNA-binding protein
LKVANLPKSETDHSDNNKRGPYLKPLREQAMRQIRKFIIDEGYTPSEVMQRLKIPSRTFQRYLHQAFAPERKVLATRLTDDEVLNQLAILESRLTKSRRDIINMAKDPTIDSKRLTAIVAAYHLSEEIAATIFKIHS